MALLAIRPALPLLPAHVAQSAIPALCGIGALLAVAALLTGREAVAIGPFHIAVDGLAGFGLLPLLLLGSIGGARGAAVLAAMMLAVLAADVVGFGVAILGMAALLRIPSTLGWAATVLIALLLLALQGGLEFQSVRGAPPDLLLAGAVLLLLVGGLAALAWRPPAEAPLLLTFGLFVLIRLTLDLCGPATPPWFGVPVLAAGLAGTVRGGVRLSLCATLDDAVPGGALVNGGLTCMGIGVALAARGADVPPLAALALAGALLLVLTGAAALGLLRLCIAAIEDATETTALDGLGGVLARMPGTGLATLLAIAGLAGLPPFAGFAGLYLVLQALLAGPRLGGLEVQVGFALALAGVGLATALAAGGSVRIAGLALLGLPRSASVGVARDPSRAARIAMAAMAGLGLLLGLWPGLVLFLARPVLRSLVAAETVDAPAYLSAALAVVLAAVGAAVAWAARQSPAPSARAVPAWDGGLNRAPPVMPRYLEGVLASLPPRPALRAPSLREWLGLAAAALAVLLIVEAVR